jgi:hypothetical protein
MPISRGSSWIEISDRVEWIELIGRRTSAYRHPMLKFTTLQLLDRAFAGHFSGRGENVRNQHPTDRFAAGLALP